jgi:hypothetical protein
MESAVFEEKDHCDRKNGIVSEIKRVLYLKKGSVCWKRTERWAKKKRSAVSERKELHVGKKNPLRIRRKRSTVLERKGAQCIRE